MKTKLPYLITILSMILGVFIAILFGVNEDIFKDRIKRGLTLNAKINQIVDPEEKRDAVEAEAAKNWRYYQRYHFHSTGIGAMAMGVLVFLAFVKAPETVKLISSYFISVGGFFYPYVWLFSGMFGPTMGRTEAKEAFAVFGYMGGVFLVGLILVLILGIRYPLAIDQKN